MHFASPETARTYADRSVDRSWMDWVERTLSPAGKDVVDIGCGGGIYSFGFAAAGATTVTGIDQSPQYISEAIGSAPPSAGMSFKVGSAEHVPVPNESADIVFERALIHHLGPDAKRSNASESFRILRRGGVLAVQDRTFEDAQSTEPEHWIRASLFEVFPRLVEFERERRPSRPEYSNLLAGASFSRVIELRYDEVRKIYGSFEALAEEIRSRKGKSILFELTDAELERYVERLRARAPMDALIERDLWTVWLATK
jgi:ubiquinone/menaquinone biosynthesis C-methylase UbiE